MGKASGQKRLTRELRFCADARASYIIVRDLATMLKRGETLPEADLDAIIAAVTAAIAHADRILGDR